MLLRGVYVSLRYCRLTGFRTDYFLPLKYRVACLFGVTFLHYEPFIADELDSQHSRAGLRAYRFVSFFFVFLGVQDGLYTYQGSDEPYVSGNDGRVKDNSFDGNIISNTDVATKIKEGDDNSFTSE